MPRSKPVITLNFRPPAIRWLLLLPALLAIFGGWCSARWYVGNTIAEYAPPADQGGIDMARVAVRWAPDDPLTHWRLASFEDKAFSAENIAAAVQEYQLAVKASPYDYRYWMELGRALEAAGDRDSSEKALRRAVELAPSYSHPLWQYGNVLLRQGKFDEAFVQLSRAAEADEQMRAAVFGLASQVFENDLDKILKAIPAPAVRLQIAIYLTNGRDFDRAMRVLQTISPADRKAQRPLVDEVAKSLIQNNQFHAAFTLLREIEPEADQLSAPEQFWNGGFEYAISPTDKKIFHWVINSRPQHQISIDTRAHSGSGSLRIIFKSPNKLETIPVAQTIVVEPNTQYRIQFYQRTEDLVSASTPFVAVIDPAVGSGLTNSQPLLTGTHDWQQVTLDFKTNPKSDGIAIRIFRGSCGEGQTICPIFGTIWYDDFNIQRIGGPGPARKSAGNNR